MDAPPIPSLMLLETWATYCGGAIGPQFLERNGGQPVGQHLQVGRKAAEPRRMLEAAFVHVERAVELDLDGVQARGRIAVMLGDEPPA